MSRSLFRPYVLPRTIPATMPPHILHVVDSLAPQADSIGVALPGLLRELPDADGHGTVAVMDGRTEIDVAFDTNHWQVCGGGPSTAAQLVDRADVVHIHGLRHRGAALFAQAARKQRTPYVLAPHGAFSSSALSRRTIRQRLVGRFSDRSLLRSAAAIQALHRIEARELCARVPTATVVELPYSADVEGESIADTSPAVAANGDARYLLMLGPIDPAEGVVAVLKSLAEIGKTGDGWHIVLAGPTRGEWRAMLEAGIRRKGCAARVQFHEASNIRSQRDWLKRASLLVAGSMQIHPAVSIMQAAALGVPVLATNRVAPDDLSNHLFACGPTRAALRMRLREALELDDAARLAQAATALECFKTRFDWRVLAPQYGALYRRVTAAK